MDSSEIFPCDQCTKVFGTLGKYNQHLKTHSRPYVCDRCSDKFGLRADLNRHVHARHRVGQSKYPCTIAGCSFKATRQDNVRQHLRKSHPEHPRTPTSQGRVYRKASITSPASPRNTTNTIAEPISFLSTFMQAASTGNIGLLEFTLNLGADISMVADDGSTALHCAVKTGQIATMQYLLRVGSKTDTKNLKGRSPLLEAVDNRDLQAFTLLLHSGAAVPQYALDEIIKHGQTDLLQCAITHSKDSLLQNCDQYMFRLATKYDQSKVMEMLLAVGHFDRAWIELFGEQAVYNMMSQGCTEVLRCLVKVNGINLNMRVRTNLFESLLHVAAAKGQSGIVDILLACETIKVNVRDDHDYTPLQKAALSGNSDVVDSLLRHPDININQCTRRATALHLACRLDRLHIVELLLRHEKVIVNYRDVNEQTALETAVSHGAHGAAQVLLAQPEYSVRDQNPGSMTLLQLAAQGGQLLMLKLLLGHKDVSLDDSRNSKHSLLREAIWNMQWHVVSFLLVYEGELTRSAGDADSAPRDVAMNEGSDTLDLLLSSQSFSVRETDQSGQGLLHKAAKKGALFIMTALLSHGQIDINLLDNKGWSALHCAAFSNQLGAVELLLNHDSIDINIAKHRVPWHQGVTALMLAKRKEFTNIIDVLVSHGAIDSDRHLDHTDSRQRQGNANEQNEYTEWYGVQETSDTEQSHDEESENNGHTNTTAILIHDSADGLEDAASEDEGVGRDDDSSSTDDESAPLHDYGRLGSETFSSLHRRHKDRKKGINKFGRPMMGMM